MSTRHLWIAIDRPAQVVYDYAAEPTRMHEWASGLAGKPLEREGSRWKADSPMGEVHVDFCPPNEFGVLDHTVTLPSGEAVYNPLRVIADGAARCEVIFTLRQRDMSAEQFAADAQHVEKDLATLKAQAEAS